MARRRIIIEGSSFATAEIKVRLLALPGINSNLIQVVVSIIQLANELALSLPAFSPYETPEEKQKVIALILLVRLIEIVESVLILSVYGVRQELDTLFRVFLDAYFLIANVCSDPKFVQVYLKTDECERLKLINVGVQHDHDLFLELKQYASESLHAELDQRIKDEKIQSFNSFLYAKKVDCTIIYDSMYRLSSASVHTSPRCVEEYVDTDGDGYITKIMHKGNADTTNRVLYNTACFLLKALRGVCELFAHPDTNNISQFETDIEAAMKAPSAR